MCGILPECKKGMYPSITGDFSDSSESNRKPADYTIKPMYQYPPAAA
jgi:hypothetical protein